MPRTTAPSHRCTLLRTIVVISCSSLLIVVRRFDDAAANGAVGGLLAKRGGNIGACDTDAVAASCPGPGGSDRHRRRRCSQFRRVAWADRYPCQAIDTPRKPVRSK